MYNKNDIVLYGNQGVCKVFDIVEKEMANEVNEYYVLKPVNDVHSTVYVPTQNEKFNYDEFFKFASITDISSIITEQGIINK